jgi:hypothetical protein
MIDINYSLRIAYTTALNGITGMPVFYNNLPPNISPDNYIVFRSITNTDASTMNSSDINTQITVEIQTFEDGINSGLTSDMVAREVFTRILPNPAATLTLDGAQMISTRLLNDITNQPVNVGNRAYVSRFLTFGHKIYLRSDIS